MGVIRGAAVLAAGTWTGLDGTRTFTCGDLLDVIAASRCPGIGDPRVMLRHGINPAVGWAVNLRLSDSGDRVLADLHLPGWVAASAYQGRSPEVQHHAGCTGCSRRYHRTVIRAVALCGGTEQAMPLGWLAGGRT